MEIIDSEGGEQKRTNWNIPLEIWTDIISFLPVKSLLRFRSVCKAWKATIQNPTFTYLHLKRCPNNLLASTLIVLAPSTVHASLKKYRWFIHNTAALQKTYEMKFQPDGVLPRSAQPRIVGSANGLLLLHWMTDQYMCNEFVLWNPSIQKSQNYTLPPFSPPTSSSMLFGIELFLTFDPSSNDYKVVAIFHIAASERPYPQPLVEVYSLKDRCWRKVLGDSNCRCVHRQELERSVYVGRYTHWIGKYYSLIDTYNQTTKLLISFDSTFEKFSYTQLPNTQNSGRLTPIIVPGGYVGVLLLSGLQSQIWVLKDSSSSDFEVGNISINNWTKWCLIDFDYLLPKPLLIEKDGKLLYHEGHEVLSYDPNTQKSEVCYRRRETRWVSYLDCYIESLVLLD